MGLRHDGECGSNTRGYHRIKGPERYAGSSKGVRSRDKKGETNKSLTREIMVHS